jgi:hypothetical protein
LSALEQRSKHGAHSIDLGCLRDIWMRAVQAPDDLVQARVLFASQQANQLLHFGGLDHGFSLMDRTIP